MTYPGEPPPRQPYPPRDSTRYKQPWPGQYCGHALPYGQQQHPPPGYAPPPRRQRMVGRTIFIVLGSVVGLVVVLGIIGAAAGRGSHTVTVGVGSRESPTAFPRGLPGSSLQA